MNTNKSQQRTVLHQLALLDAGSLINNLTDSQLEIIAPHYTGTKMNVTMLVSGIITWLFLVNSFASSAASSENENSPLNSDSVTKLAEHLTKMSDQLNQLSENQAKQSDQLSKLSDRLSEQTDQFTNQLNEMSNRLNTLEEERTQDDVKKEVITQISELEQRLKKASSAGPTFIRWGRRSCNGTNSEMVYLGLAAGTQDGTQGGSSNLLCLPRNPEFGNYDSVQHPGAEVDVAEYKLDPANNFPFEHNDPLLLDNNIPCAVCEVTNGSSVMMIPARVDCYTGWSMEYRGYLMAEKDEIAHEIDFVCVDANPEAADGGGGAAEFSVGLYPVLASTNPGSLPSPPYGENWELACVVCSK